MPITRTSRVTIQSMTTTKTADTAATIGQIHKLEAAGCDIVRVAVPDMQSADAIAEIRKNIGIPLVADIHFDYKLAIRAVCAGADKIRINPGNIGNPGNIKELADACRGRGVPIRVGANGGSLPKEIPAKHGGVTAQALAESVMDNVKILEECGFHDIWLSAKCSKVPLTVETYRLLHKQTDLPLHIGITEAGTEYNGIIKSAAGIGALLLDGIGDTIRISLAGDPLREVIAAHTLLRSLGLRGGVDVIACPTCGRCNIDIASIASEVERRLEKHRISDIYNRSETNKTFTVAVMGCAVNGPGEASHADCGIAGGIGEGLLFVNGETVGKAPAGKLTDALTELIDKMPHPVV